MTKSTITREQAQKIIVAADEVITALAGTNEDVHPDDSKKMCELWDDLNDRHAPPVVVRELARMALAAMDSEPVAFTEKHEISNMHATGLYLRAWPADRARNAVEGYTIPLYTTPQPISLVNSEPVAYIFKHPAGRLFWALTDKSNKGQNDVMPVYASPQPAPEEWTIADAVKFCKETGRQDAGAAMDAWNACRAAMLQENPVCTCPSGDGSLRWPCPVHPGNSPVVPDEVEHVAAVLELIGSFEAADIDSDTVDLRFEIDDVDTGSDASITEYAARGAAIIRMLAGNSPAIPDGYVLVPKEATKEILDEFDSIIDYGAEDSVDAWHRLLAAATQEVKP